jgi:hypothetical protein
MDYHLLNVVDEESERYVAPNYALGSVTEQVVRNPPRTL